ncbi:glycerophosphodiester phosphodiesterase family protein [Solirubrobacter soli]|uniref:glycerophosphodiester phosphodiesterase family protein n=1 Tax=Solirubrobacter soli TaxID=363832 RepID=UPI0004188E07|nr:glycerophosphodiester phosphodiesterase family protein [Solirubrobacter soli]
MEYERGVVEEPRRPRSTVPDTAPVRHPLLALQGTAGNQAATRWVQRQFVEQTTARRVVPPSEIATTLKDVDLQKLIAGRLGGPVEPEKAVPYALKKLAEGPDITFTTKEELVKNIDQRLAQIAPTAGDEPTSRGRRKLNRIVGQLNEKLQRLAATQTAAKKLLDKFGPVVEYASRPADKRDDQKLLIECQACLDAFSVLLSGDVHGMWVGYDAVSSFGPLGHALVTAAGTSKGADGLKDVHGQNLGKLREIRRLMATRPGVSVVAHRGSGPTNRTMGGLIAQADQRRTTRPAENSPDAFKAALDETTHVESSTKPPVPRLDGVECDVFLSQDRVPILTHEGRIKEQLNQIRQTAENTLAETTEVHQVTADRIKQILRTQSPTSRFITLTEFLAQVRPYGQLYFEATGFPLRVEIEMKGTKHDNDFAHAEGESPLTKAVAKIVSQEIKSAQGNPVEYILFNGTPADIPVFSAVRTEKSALGGLYTGTAPASTTLPETFNKLWVDELRYQFTTAIPPRDQIEKFHAKTNPKAAEVLGNLLKGYIVTLVYGQEFAPRDHPAYNSPELQGSEPTHDIALTGRTSDQVTKALERRIAHGTDTEELIQLWLEWYVKGGGQVSHLHVLTDFPAKAWWMKDKLSKV